VPEKYSFAPVRQFQNNWRKTTAARGLRQCASPYYME
jgi:hypothetical protein